MAVSTSGIAEILAELGYIVQGSDQSENNNVRRLRSLGIEVKTPQHPDNLEHAALVVKSTAIKDDNVELEARQRFLPVVHRAEMLGELDVSALVCGSCRCTHGKKRQQPRWSLPCFILPADPTVINGGIISSWGSNARLGAGDWMVVEADESDGFAPGGLKPTVAIVTNIDPEHLDHHGSVENLELAFAKFVASIPFYGFASYVLIIPRYKS